MTPFSCSGRPIKIRCLKCYHVNISAVNKIDHKGDRNVVYKYLPEILT